VRSRHAPSNEAAAQSVGRNFDEGLVMFNHRQSGTAAALGVDDSAAAVTAALLRSARRTPPAAFDAAACGATMAALALSAPGGACLALARREFVVLRGMQAQVLSCESGELWVTLESDATDYVLQPGTRLCVPANASAIVTAVATSALRVAASSCDGAGIGRRWTGLFMGASFNAVRRAFNSRLRSLRMRLGNASA
jgi:hypothetical protein